MQKTISYIFGEASLLKTKYQSILNKANLPGKKAELKTSETQSYEASFWEDPKKAGEIMKRITDLKKEIEDLEIIELLLEENQLKDAEKLINKYEVTLYQGNGFNFTCFCNKIPAHNYY